MKKIRIQDRLIGEGEPVFIIAEAGVNHNGDITLAKKLVNVAKEAGADVVKFQTFKAENLVTKDALMASYQSKNTGIKQSQQEMLKKLELNYENFNELKNYCDEKDIIFLSTPHTEDAADYLDDLVPAFKIGSGDLTNLPYLEKIAKKGKPIILGTGMGTIGEVKEAVEIITRYNDQLILLHCTTNYPCPKSDVNLLAMKTMQKETGCIVGYSDHTEGVQVPKYAVSLGAQVIEKHFTLDKNMDGPDHKASLDPYELKEMVQKIRSGTSVEIPNDILGDGIKKPTKDEIEIAKVARKSIVSKTNIPKGTKITMGIIQIKRPGTGIPPKELKNVLGKIVRKDICEDSVIERDDIYEKN